MNSIPKRIQLSCKKGWRNPPNTVVVARPSRWGNPFKVGRDGSPEECVEKYKEMVSKNIWTHPNAMEIKEQLNGKNLACWCEIGKPCHGDYLLSIANSG